MTLRFDPAAGAITGHRFLLADIAPVLDGVVIEREPAVRATAGGAELAWDIGDARFVLDVASEPAGLVLTCRVEGLDPGAPLDSFGLRFGRVGNLRAYLRNGYQSWDGSFYVEPEALHGHGFVDEKLRTGYAMTQILPRQGRGSLVMGFLRHDRFQHRLRFGLDRSPLALTVETLWDQVPHGGRAESEKLLVFAHDGVEEALRRWAREVVAASPVPARVSEERITGWCSWYNLYAAIDEERILDHLTATRAAADADGLDLRVFQIDDGFTPEMGDWLEVKPQFPRGIKPMLDDIRAAGFTPGLWIAPFLVGNRSRLYREHPDWVVRERASGHPVVAMRFYGEFRWHKRSEEYYVLDVTHPEAEAHIRNVFRTWAQDWGCRYFKTDFMHFGSAWGADEVWWHEPGLTRIEVFVRMMRLIREEIGDATWIGCGCPLLPSVGYVDAMRIGRDVGVKWGGEQSAESLLRDQATRNFTHGIFWQGDPDCVLLRERFHHLADHEVEALAIFAGLSGGVALTSDHFAEIPSGRRRLWKFLLGDGRSFTCDFPFLGASALRYRPGRAHDGTPALVVEGDPVVVQRVWREGGPAAGAVVLNFFNTGNRDVERFYGWEELGVPSPQRVREGIDGPEAPADPQGLRLVLRPHEACLLIVS